jgi:hypothetical protein
LHHPCKPFDRHMKLLVQSCRPFCTGYLVVYTSSCVSDAFPRGLPLFGKETCIPDTLLSGQQPSPSSPAHAHSVSISSNRSQPCPFSSSGFAKGGTARHFLIRYAWSQPHHRIITLCISTLYRDIGLLVINHGRRSCTRIDIHRSWNGLAAGL